MHVSRATNATDRQGLQRQQWQRFGVITVLDFYFLYTTSLLLGARQNAVTNEMVLEFIVTLKHHSYSFPSRTICALHLSTTRYNIQPEITSYHA